MNQKPEIIYTHDDFAVINKPPGISVHGGNHIAGPTLADWLIAQFPEIKKVGDDPLVRPGMMHRLDKDTSGVMLIARTRHAFEYLKHCFKNRRVEKTYLTLVAGRIAKKRGAINWKIGRLIKKPALRGTEKQNIKNEREATTEYRALEYLPGWTLVEAKPKTGRMHQIRVHFLALGHPVAGDRAYGKKITPPAGLSRQFLHASSLSFSYPEGRRWRFEAPVPGDLARVLANLRLLRKKSK
jgi:23S rRNA pseudouridine1911/1915/1917 synthase